MISTKRKLQYILKGNPEDNKGNIVITYREKIYALFLLVMMGDTIGFHNSGWVYTQYYRHTKPSSPTEFIYEFIKLGGINGINLKGWRVSSHTLYFSAICEAFLSAYDDYDSEDFYLAVKRNMITYHDKILNDIMDPKIHFDRTESFLTFRVIEAFKKNINEDVNTDKLVDDNDPLTRSLLVGVIINGSTNRINTMTLALKLCAITHGSVVTQLASITVALFAAFAIELIPVEKWLDELLFTLRLPEVIAKFPGGMSSYFGYLTLWEMYISQRFYKGKLLEIKSHYVISQRFKFYADLLASPIVRLKPPKEYMLGSEAIGCVIVAYDTLLDCGGKWEKLVIYGMLNIAENNSIGSIAAGLYALVYGLGDVPLQLFDHLEYKDHFIILSRQFIKKFGNSPNK